MGCAYSLHTPLALATALRRGLNTVDHPWRAGPFYLLIPMNTQPSALPMFNLSELPVGPPPPLGAAADNGAYDQAVQALRSAQRKVVKVGGGARSCGPELLEFLDLVDAVAVTSPLVSGVIPFNHPRNMTVGGSKGSISGNYAMASADLLVAIGSRFVCQSDCSRTGYPEVECVININADPDAATHYGKTIALVGDAASTLRHIMTKYRASQVADSDIVTNSEGGGRPSTWMQECTQQRQAWEAYKKKRYCEPTLYDETWREVVLTQSGAIKIATDWARANDAVCFFDSGDVQANAFQIVEDDRLGRTFTETGASYMGFAVSSLLATALADQPFYGMAITGDGSFMMNPQILIDGVEHGARGCILVLDNRRMSAISSLQIDQYGRDFATRDSVKIDYPMLARAVKGIYAADGGRTPAALVEALRRAKAHEGLSLVHVPVYFGPNELGGMGAFGRWNVGNWCEETQAVRHDIGL
jgi:3D-(3,5/4)-trihydroxycyclohexane-1,2-dione acylhydrolase (decyclizing)